MGFFKSIGKTLSKIPGPHQLITGSSTGSSPIPFVKSQTFDKIMGQLPHNQLLNKVGLGGGNANLGPGGGGILGRIMGGIMQPNQGGALEGPSNMPMPPNPPPQMQPPSDAGYGTITPSNFRPPIMGGISNQEGPAPGAGSQYGKGEPSGPWGMAMGGQMNPGQEMFSQNNMGMNRGTPQRPFGMGNNPMNNMMNPYQGNMFGGYGNPNRRQPFMGGGFRGNLMGMLNKYRR